MPITDPTTTVDDRLTQEELVSYYTGLIAVSAQKKSAMMDYCISCKDKLRAKVKETGWTAAEVLPYLNEIKSAETTINDLLNTINDAKVKLETYSASSA